MSGSVHRDTRSPLRDFAYPDCSNALTRRPLPELPPELRFRLREEGLLVNTGFPYAFMVKEAGVHRDHVAAFEAILRPHPDLTIDALQACGLGKVLRRGRVRADLVRLREVGTAARTQIEKLGTKVYLDLRVKIAKNWQRDPKQLGRLGF